MGFSDSVKKQLREAVGFYCSAPFCGAQTHTYNEALGQQQFTGEAAHIFGLREGSARHSALPMGWQPNDFDNGIWLCRQCHRMVDQSAELFPGDDLITWKLTAQQAHNAGGRRRMAIPYGADVQKEFDRAKAFVSEFQHLRAFMHNVYFSSWSKSRFTSTFSVPIKTIHQIRQIAGVNGVRWQADHPNWCFLPDFQNWMHDLVHRTKLLSLMPSLQFNASFTNYVDFYNEVDAQEVFFTDPTARMLHLLLKHAERFDNFLASYQGPYQGLPVYGYPQP